jgi:hypothetical protein
VRAKQLDNPLNSQTKMDKTVFPSSLQLSSIRLLDKLEEKEYDTCAEGVVRFESSPRYQFHQPVKVGKYQIQRRGIEQWLARRAHNPEVAGSNPVPATSKAA